MIKQIFKQSLLGFAIFTLGKIINILLFVYLGKAMDINVFGNFVFLFTVAQIIIFISDLGTQNWYLKGSAKVCNPSASIVVLRLTFGVFFSLVFVFLLNIFSKISVSIVSVLAIVVLEVVSAQIDNYFIKKLKQFVVGFRYLIKMGIALVATFYILNNYGQNFVLQGYFFGLIISILVFLPILNLKSTLPDFAIFKSNNLKEILSLGYINFLSLLYAKGDSFLLGTLAGSGAVSFYSGAYRIYEALCVLPQNIAQNILVRVGVDPTIKNTFRRVVVVSFFIGLLIAIFNILFGSAIFNFFYGSKFNKSIGVFNILSLIIPLTFASGPLVSKIIIEHKSLAIFKKLATVNTFLNIFLNIVLIAKYSFVGSAVAFLVTELTGFFINIYIYKFYCNNEH